MDNIAKMISNKDYRNAEISINKRLMEKLGNRLEAEKVRISKNFSDRLGSTEEK